MSRKKTELQLAGEPQEERGLLEAVIGEGVMDGLGAPDGLHHVQVKHLWDGHYRVNVFVGADAVSAKVAHSYFLNTDGNGKILASVPAITTLY